MDTEEQIERVKEVFISYDYHEQGFLDANDTREAFSGKWCFGASSGW